MPKVENDPPCENQLNGPEDYASNEFDNHTESIGSEAHCHIRVRYACANSFFESRRARTCHT